MMRWWAIFVLAAVLATGCSDRRAAATPKRHAYPRAAVMPDSSVMVTAEGVDMRLNASARIERPERGWIDARYDGQGATLHLSVVRAASAAELDKAVANRQQRINLNIGESGAETGYFKSESGFECLLIVTREVCATPVQVLAKGPGNRLVSGAFVINGRAENVDSMRPVVHELELEGQRILESLSVSGRSFFGTGGQEGFLATASTDFFGQENRRTFWDCGLAEVFLDRRTGGLEDFVDMASPDFFGQEDRRTFWDCGLAEARTPGTKIFCFSRDDDAVGGKPSVTFDVSWLYRASWPDNFFCTAVGRGGGLQTHRDFGKPSTTFGVSGLYRASWPDNFFCVGVALAAAERASAYFLV